MKFPRRVKPASAQLEAEASSWVIRCERGLGPEEQDEFLQWMAADRRHSQEYARQRNNWLRLGLLADWRPEHSPRPNRDLLAPAPKAKAIWLNARRSRIAQATLAAAAIVALGLFVVRNQTIHPPASTQPAQIAAIEERALADGSMITLNRGAEVSVHYAIDERRVVLERGEAHFEVAELPDRPFVVSVRGFEVRAVGTAFNVRLDPAAVEVLVTEGRVEVEQGDQPDSPTRQRSNSPVPEPSTIDAGQRGLISLGPDASPLEIAPVTVEQMEQLSAWRPSFLDFSDTPLRSIVAEFNRRNAPIRISIADASLAQTVVSASLRSDNIEGFIRLLEFGFGVEAERLGNTVNLRRAKSSERDRVR